MPKPPIASGTIRLKNGKTLGYAISGDPVGRPVFFFHGLPGSRLQRHPDDSITASLGARLITVDRPGFGLSDPAANRTLLDWPDDVAELADHLGMEKFAVAGISAGGPYCAACACKIPQRITRAAIISGVGLKLPRGGRMAWQSRASFALIRRAPALLAPPVWLIARAAQRFPGAYLDWIAKNLPPADREILLRPEIRAMFAQDLREAFRQGIGGYMQDLGLIAGPWGFSPERISAEVYLWHGEEDTIIPPAAGRDMAQRIPRCRSFFLPGEGHLLALDHWEEILRTLLS